MPKSPGLTNPTLSANQLPNQTNTTVPDYGRDLWCLDDVDPGGQEVTGLTCLAQAIYRRLITPRGTLLGDRDYGFDITQFLNDDIDNRDIGRITANVDAEIIKDQRVKSSTTTATFINGTLTLTTAVTPSSGPTFTLVIAASNLTVQMLQFPS